MLTSYYFFLLLGEIIGIVNRNLCEASYRKYIVPGSIFILKDLGYFLLRKKQPVLSITSRNIKQIFVKDMSGDINIVNVQGLTCTTEKLSDKLDKITHGEISTQADSNECMPVSAKHAKLQEVDNTVSQHHSKGNCSAAVMDGLRRHLHQLEHIENQMDEHHSDNSTDKKYIFLSLLTQTERHVEALRKLVYADRNGCINMEKPIKGLRRVNRFLDTMHNKYDEA